MSKSTALMRVEDDGRTHDGRRKLKIFRVDIHNREFVVSAVEELKPPNFKMWGAPLNIMDECIDDVERHWNLF